MKLYLGRMHDSLKFRLEGCIYRQDVPSCLKWENDYLVGIMLHGLQENPFENPDILQSFLRQVKKTKSKPQRERLVFKSWVNEYGFLAPEEPFSSLSTLEDASDLVEARYPGSALDPSIILPINTTVNLLKESICSFWTEARKLVLLWDMFEAVSNQNLEALKEFIVIENTGAQEPTPLNQDAIIFRGKVEKFNFTMDLSSSPEEIAKNHVYQLLGFVCVKSEIEKYLTDLTLSSNLKSLNPTNLRDHDAYKLDYYIRPKNLLQAFYLQFYILLNGIHNKVCPHCWKPFSPSKREDQIYCSKKCKGTAKKSRQRQDHPELVFKDSLDGDIIHDRLSATDRKKIMDTIDNKGLRDAKALRKELIKQKKTRT